MKWIQLHILQLLQLQPVTAAVMLPNPSLLFCTPCWHFIVWLQLLWNVCRKHLYGQHYLSLSLSRWLRFNERNNMRYLFINARYGQSLPPASSAIAIRKFHMQIYPAGVEPGNGEWFGRGEGGMSTVHVADGEAAAINHIHSLPVERAFNLHAELHIACGRCLPTFLPWFSLAWTESEAVLRHTKVFNFICLINLYNRIKISSKPKLPWELLAETIEDIWKIIMKTTWTVLVVCFAFEFN